MRTREKAVEALKAGAAAMLWAGLKEFKREMSREGFDLDDKVHDARKLVDRTARLAKKKAERILAEVQDELIEPTTERVERAWHELTTPRQRVPTWAKIALGGIGAGAIVYGLVCSERVQSFVRPVVDTLRGDE